MAQPGGQHFYGWRPDLPDHRDHLYSAPADDLVTAPPVVDLRPQMPPVVDQGRSNSCTANAIAAAVQWEQMKQGAAAFPPSRLMIYYGEREMEGDVGSDGGAVIRSGMKVVAQQGVAPESMWPFTLSRLYDKPADSCYAEAQKHQVTQYLSVPQNRAQIEASLAAGYPVVFGFTVYDSFESDEVASTGVVPLPGPDENVLGGHAVLLVGYDRPSGVFFVRNSWGTGWGQAGYCTMRYSHVLDPNLADSFWSVRLVEDPAVVVNPTPPPAPPPSPGPAPQPVSPTPTPTLTVSPLWVFLKPEDVEQGDDPRGLVEFLKRCHGSGYNGAVLWDTDLSKNGIEDYVRREYDAVNAWASDARFSIAAQICPQNETMEAWWGVKGATEVGAVNGEHYICLAVPEVHDAYAKMVANVLSVFPKGSPLAAIFPFYDEFRLQGTHPRCRKPGGPLLAAHAKKTLDLFRAHAPHLRPAVWNDCFDPNHNAVTPYYNVYGGLAGAEAGIGPDVLILNWCTKGDSVLDSFRFWSARGNEQVYFGFYDGAGGDGVSASDERKLIRAVQKNAGVVGYCYTTWQADYSQLGAYLTPDGWASPGRITPGPVTPPAPSPTPTPPPPSPGPGPAPPPSPGPGPDPTRVLVPFGEIEGMTLEAGKTYLLASGDWGELDFTDEQGEDGKPIRIGAQEPGGVTALFRFGGESKFVEWVG